MTYTRLFLKVSQEMFVFWNFGCPRLDTDYSGGTSVRGSTSVRGTSVRAVTGASGNVGVCVPVGASMARSAKRTQSLANPFFVWLHAESVDFSGWECPRLDTKHSGGT